VTRLQTLQLRNCFDSLERKNISLLFKKSSRTKRPTHSPSIQSVPENLSSEVKQQGYEESHATATKAKVKSKRTFASTFPHTCMTYIINVLCTDLKVHNIQCILL
jgi:hypothetical protein